MSARFLGGLFHGGCSRHPQCSAKRAALRIAGSHRLWLCGARSGACVACARHAGTCDPRLRVVGLRGLGARAGSGRKTDWPGAGCRRARDRHSAYRVCGADRRRHRRGALPAAGPTRHYRRPCHRLRHCRSADLHRAGQCEHPSSADDRKRRRRGCPAGDSCHPRRGPGDGRCAGSGAGSWSGPSPPTRRCGNCCCNCMRSALLQTSRSAPTRAPTRNVRTGCNSRSCAGCWPAKTAR